MKTRAITGFFFVAVMLASVLFSQYAFACFFFFLIIFSLAEFYKLTSSAQIKPQKFLGMLLAASAYIPLAFYYISHKPIEYLFITIPVSLAAIVTELYRRAQNPFHNIAYTLFGVLFASVPFCFFFALAFRDELYNAHYPLGFLLLLWASDTGAYLFGISLGKTKLFERHSPKKTWEGFAGGLLTSLATGWILSLYFKELSLYHWLAVSVIVVIAGTLGDLTESMLKRSVEVKDSGNFLPGHGGLLDRFDGFLLAAPLVFVYLQLIRLV